ncbi:peptide-methionine (R)-S-oxide reductase MsrB [Sphingomonas kaistensis]|uniref:Peptide methionine sulfoxide reductase MsrB n=1 Tax=Sphingomonas kaistensis TaxID=298708 RepID=A0ABZ2G1C5_9SPHN
MSDQPPTKDMPQTEQEWLDKLGPERFNILRRHGTERAWTGELLGNKAAGEYVCGGCGASLFESDTKYDSGSGWPSFTAPVESDAVTNIEDNSLGMQRVEVRCAKCAGHLGHVFPDGPGPEGLRYCINSASLDFKPKE